MFKKISLLIILGGGLLLIACAKKEAPQKEEFPLLSEEQIRAIKEKMRSLKPVPVEEDEVAVIETNMGKIVFKFFPDVAPIHCANFKKLANNGFYDGTTFHRVIPDFVIQGGDINSRDGDRDNDGTGDPGYRIPAEFSNKPHLRGTVSMARGPDPNSAGSQFFICLKRLPHLDGQYSVFGQVIEGMDVVDKIAHVPRDRRDNPIERVVMKKVYVVKR